MNVLLITTDQQRADSIGAYGNPVCATPNLDRLAADGTRFTAARTQHMLCQPSRATIATGTYPSTHGVTCNGIDLPEHWADKTISAHLGRAGHETAIFGKAHFASVYPFVPTGRLESVEGSAYMPEDWTGPYFGFEHAELILFGHNMRMAPLQGNWNWCFGPAPMGLHYGRYLFRDGPERGRERLAQMQPEWGGGTYDHTQTWVSSLPEEDHPTTWVADRADRVAGRGRRRLLRVGELHRPAPPDGPARAVGASVRPGGRPRGAADRAPRGVRREAADPPVLDAGQPRRALRVREPGRRALHARRAGRA